MRTAKRTILILALMLTAIPAGVVSAAEEHPGSYLDGRRARCDLSTGLAGVQSQAASTVVSMMENDQAFYATQDDVQLAGYRIASKTGTAYVALNGAYTNQSTVSYAAIAPADNPQYVVITSVGLPYKGNSHLVGAAVRDVLAQVLVKNHVAPSTGEMTQYPMYW